MTPRVDPEPVAGRLEPRTAADPGVRARDPARDRRRDPGRRPALGRARRPARRRRRRRGLGGAVRHRRRSALPRHHRQPDLLRRRRQGPRGRAPDLGRRPRHLGRGRRSAASAPGSAVAAGASRCRRSPTPSRPGVVLAQAIGRCGNWFNQELFGAPTDLPWGLEIDPANRPAGYEQFETFHPTFLYESLWCVLVAVVLIWADKRWTMGHGRVFALYVAALLRRPRRDRDAAHRRRATASSASGSTSSPRSSSSSAPWSTSSSAPGCGPVARTRRRSAPPVGRCADDRRSDDRSDAVRRGGRRARRCRARCRCSRGRTIAVGRLGTRRAVGARCG